MEKKENIISLGIISIICPFHSTYSSFNTVPLTVLDGFKSWEHDYLWVLSFQQFFNLGKVDPFGVREGFCEVADQWVLDILTANHWQPGSSPTGRREREEAHVGQSATRHVFIWVEVWLEPLLMLSDCIRNPSALSFSLWRHTTALIFKWFIMKHMLKNLWEP